MSNGREKAQRTSARVNNVHKLGVGKVQPLIGVLEVIEAGQSWVQASDPSNPIVKHLSSCSCYMRAQTMADQVDVLRIRTHLNDLGDEATDLFA